MTPEQFRRQRKIMGLTQTQLGEKMDVAKNTIGVWERGEVPEVAALAINWLSFTARQDFVNQVIDAHK